MTPKLVQQFEAQFAEYQGAASARAFGRGRVGLYAVLRALGVGTGDHVGICAYTCYGVIEPIIRLGARPVFLDVDRHMNIAPASLERQAGSLRALIVQHTFGVPAPIDAYLAWTRTNNVPMIEDCCHAPGATWEGTKVGNFGVGGVFSLEWSKPFPAGQGGIFSFADAGLAREVDRVIAREGITPSAAESLSLSAQRKLHRWLVTPKTRDAIRAVYRWVRQRGLLLGAPPMTESLPDSADGFLKLCSASQAKAALKAFHRWPELMQRRKENAAALMRRFAQEGIAVIEADPRSDPMYLRVPIRVSRKPQAMQAGKRLHLDIGGWFATPADPLQGEPLVQMGYDPATCPMAEDAFAHVVTLATHPSFSPDQLDALIRIIRDAV